LRKGRDRDAARNSLWRFIPPSAAAMKAKSHAEFIAALHALETLIDVAQPIPPALAEHLEPWLAESRRRRGAILADNRRADANRRPSAVSEAAR
jgi:hypothetical protein